MPAVTTAYVKNIIRRGFSELVDPSPSRQEKLLVWNHFADSCAYCGVRLPRNSKEAHIDHLVSAAHGGSNALGNRVLSCAPCNEKEKLDRPWEEFLRTKANTDAEFAARRQRIMDWSRTHPVSDEPRRKELIEFSRARADELVAQFDQAVAVVRQKAAIDSR